MKAFSTIKKLLSTGLIAFAVTSTACGGDTNVSATGFASVGETISVATSEGSTDGQGGSTVDAGQASGTSTSTGEGQTTIIPNDTGNQTTTASPESTSSVDTGSTQPDGGSTSSENSSTGVDSTSGTTNSSTSTTGELSSSTSGGESSSTGEPVLQCQDAVQKNACQVCAVNKCCAEVEACLQDEKCVCWLGCIEHIEGFNNCWDQCASGTIATSKLYDCTGANCLEGQGCD